MSEIDNLEQEARRLAQVGATDAKAEEINRRLLTLNPSNQNALTRLARILTETGRDRDALQVYFRCLELDPDNLIARNNVSRLGGKFVTHLASEQSDQRLAPIHSFIKIVRSALGDSFAVHIPTEAPNSEDLRLIEYWMPGITESNRESEERRMLSARTAEKAVAAFFRKRGHAVEDVSLTQIIPTASRDWTLYDLKVDGAPIDVKNARRSEKNPKRYVSHCVARFKEDRELRAVQIAGVLSDWLSTEQTYSTENKVLFLGLVNSKRVEEISNEISGNFLEVSFRDGLRGPSFLPPWLFSYPTAEYEKLGLALAQLKTFSFPDWKLSGDANISPVAVFLAAGRRYEFNPGLPLSAAQNSLLDLLLARHAKLGLRLPTVFLSVLEHFVGILANGTQRDFRPQDYSSIIFPVEDRCRPLFLFDPLQTVNTLLGALTTLWQARSTALSGFKIFRLQDLNILQGKRSALDPQWTTLLAYCGGWTGGPFSRPCGTTPLVLGCESSCECGKLICPNCEFCSKPCAQGVARMSRLAKTWDHETFDGLF